VVQSGNAWIVMCGGGDIYEMAGAIYKSAGDISRLKGTDLNVTGITNANPGLSRLISLMVSAQAR
jgi:hypothetical protein